MKVLHFITGAETGGSRKHVITLLEQFAADEAVLALMHDGPFAEEARSKGIRTIVFSQNSRYDLSILKKIASFLSNERFDLLHTHGPRANLFGVYLKRKTGIRWVTTVHSDPALDFVKSGVKGKLFTALSMYAIKKMDGYFAVSERFKQNLIKLGIDSSKIQTVYNGIQFTDDQAVPVHRDNLGLSVDDFVMTMVARLHPIKGHTVVFDALREIPEADRPHLLLVGDGPIKDELMKEAASRSLSSHVHFLGFRKDVDGIYAASDLALLASYSESFPLALLEAANQHVPILTTDVGGVKELVEPGRTGWVVPPGDSLAYREAIEEAIVLHQEGKLRERGNALYAYAADRYSLKQLEQSTRKLYHALLEHI
ncbi:glycosyltransferase [Pseudobacillus badius]|uniref:glycosyltransferase n=1 Tax=Bacillus badius TaxID=1455 RepID=UPI0007B3D34B|nr:glycosyltransferase [Bacillus badius]KZR57554.1 glycosyltransferase [Bacillus badius]